VTDGIESTEILPVEGNDILFPAEESSSLVRKENINCGYSACGITLVE
jgi:hypothetical protein